MIGKTPNFELNVLLLRRTEGDPPLYRKRNYQTRKGPRLKFT